MKKIPTIKIFILIALLSIIQNSSAQKPLYANKIDELRHLGNIEYGKKEYEKAIPYYTQVVENDYKDHIFLNTLGLCYYHLKNYEKAKEYFRLAILYSENIASYHSNLAATYQYLDDIEKAYYYARKGLEIEETEHTLFNASSLANLAGKPDDCIKLLDNSKLEKSNDFNKIYAEAFNAKGNMGKSIEYYERFFHNFYSGHSDEEFDYYNQVYHYFKDVINNFVKSVSENNGAENYLSKVDSLYVELTHSNQKNKTIEKTLNSINYILSKDTMYKSFFKKMLAKTPEPDEWKGDFYVSLYEMKNAIEYFESAIDENGTRKILSEKDILNLSVAFLIEYGNTLDSTIEPKMMQLYIDNNESEKYLKTVVYQIFEIIKVEPKTKFFFTTLIEKTKNEKYKDEIKYELSLIK